MKYFSRYLYLISISLLSKSLSVIVEYIPDYAIYILVSASIMALLTIVVAVGKGLLPLQVNKY